MLSDNIPDIILEETKHLPDYLQKEALDFILFLKSKNLNSLALTDSQALSSMQESELIHLEKEFENYKSLYPNE